LVRFREKDSLLELPVGVAAQLLQKLMRLAQIFAVCPFPLEEIGHRIEPQSVHTHAEPEIDHTEHRAPNRGRVVVEIRLVGVEAMPVIGLGERVPGPVGWLEVLEDNPRAAISLRRVAPDIEVAPLASRLCSPRALEPRMLVGGMVGYP